MSYEDNRDSRSNSRAADEEATDLRNLMRKLKTNFAKPQELQTLYHNEHVKERTYWPGESVWLSDEHVKTKRNPKLKHKYLGPFEILEAVGEQAYRLKLPPKWRIRLVFHVSFLERDVTRREAVHQKNCPTTRV